MRQISALILITLFILCIATPLHVRAYSDRLDDATGDMTVTTYATMVYKTFEEKIANVTDIVKAKCVDVSYHEAELHYDYKFEITVRFCGEDTGDTIFVSQDVDTFYEVINAPKSSNTPSYHSRGISYNIGEEYFCY